MGGPRTVPRTRHAPRLWQTGATAPIVAEGDDAGTINLPSGVPTLTAASYPSITTAGDGTGPSALYVTDTSGTIWALQGNPSAPDEVDPFLPAATLTKVGTLPTGVTGLHQVS
jgi:hypothetical protein